MGRSQSGHWNNNRGKGWSNECSWRSQLVEEWSREAQKSDTTGQLVTSTLFNYKHYTTQTVRICNNHTPERNTETGEASIIQNTKDTTQLKFVRGNFSLAVSPLTHLSRIQNVKERVCDGSNHGGSNHGSPTTQTPVLVVLELSHSLYQE